MSVCPILRQQWSELLGLIFKGNTEMEFYVALLGLFVFLNIMLAKQNMSVGQIQVTTNQFMYSVLSEK